MSENTSIVICGEKINIGTRVVLWNEPGGLSAYDSSAGKKYSARSLLKPNPTLDQLKGMVTQLFFHHTGNRTAESTQETLEERKLSVHII